MCNVRTGIGIGTDVCMATVNAVSVYLAFLFLSRTLDLLEVEAETLW